MPNSNRSLEGRIAIITGAASGIGAAIAKAYAEEGASVLAVDLPSITWTTTPGRTESISRLAIDITDNDAPKRIVAAADNIFGGIDILVNNAGIAPFGGTETATDDIWDKAMQINVNAIFKLTRETVPFLKKSDAGRIINTGSIMSECAGPETIAYITTKHAVAGMTKAMAIDLGKYGITANFLQPGCIVTPLSAAHMQDQNFVDYWVRKTPLGELGQPEDIASVAVFLASDASRYISGAGLRIDGGAAINAF